MSKQDDELRKEGAGELATRQMKKENKLLQKLKGKYERAAVRAKEEANPMHLTVGYVSAGVGVVGGYKGNQALRSYTSDWLNDEGERSWGAFMLADAMPVAVGGGLIALGALAFKNGAAVAATTGAGAGVIFGSVTSSVFGS